jgi:hypothetical protein
MTEPEVGRALVNAAHEICPYSKAVMAERAGAKHEPEVEPRLDAVAPRGGCRCDPRGRARGIATATATPGASAPCVDLARLEQTLATSTNR